MRGPLRWSAGRRRPYVTGAARPGRRARWLARDARAGSFAKSLPREPRKLPWGLANPWRLPALHHPASAGRGKRENGAPAPQRTGPAEHWICLVMPGHSPSKTGVNALMVPGIHVFLAAADVDGRDKPGHHDEEDRSSKMSIYLCRVAGGKSARMVAP